MMFTMLVLLEGGHDSGANSKEPYTILTTHTVRYTNQPYKVACTYAADVHRYDSVLSVATVRYVQYT